MLQDRWQSGYLEFKNDPFPTSPKTSAAFDEAGNIYCAKGYTNGPKSPGKNILKFDATGNFVRTFGSFSHLGGIACRNNEVFVLDLFGTKKISVFSPDGALLRQWGDSGSGNGQFGIFSTNYSGIYNGLAVSSEGEVFVVDPGNARVMVFGSNGTYLRQWGGSALVPGSFGNGLSPSPSGVALGPDNRAYVTSPHSSLAVQIFSKNGEYLSKINFNDAATAVSPDGVLWSGDYAFQMNTPEGESASGDKPFEYVMGLAFNQKGDMVAVGSVSGSGSYTGSHPIRYYRRVYGTSWSPVYSSSNPLGANRANTAGIDVSPSSTTSIPQPLVLKSVQRPGTALMDIDFSVKDADSPTVTVAALALANGTVSLANVLKLKTLVDGTGSKLGTNIATNTTHRLTWDVAADWSTSFGQVKIEILANDGRNLFPFHWITLPAEGTNPSLTLSKRPMVDEDYFYLWFWLIATGDPSITLTSGKVFGVGGSYNGIELASGTTTTTQGKSFLLAKLGARAITAQELARAQGGNYNFEKLSTSTAVKLP
ncbi:MAG: NHL repeat-containing protein [Candidatus Methylacidiphilales bacterium]|nr:NHL repeat-containing protein [Candidatus Methylacidiphilales bacterium]